MNQKTFDGMLKMFSDNLLLFTLIWSYLLTDLQMLIKQMLTWCYCMPRKRLWKLKSSSNCLLIRLRKSRMRKTMHNLIWKLMLQIFHFSVFVYNCWDHQIKNVVITNHFSLINLSNGKLTGYIWTEIIKIRHRDIGFYVNYRKVQYSSADYLIRHAVTVIYWISLQRRNLLSWIIYYILCIIPQ